MEAERQCVTAIGRRQFENDPTFRAVAHQEFITGLEFAYIPVSLNG